MEYRCRRDDRWAEAAATTSKVVLEMMSLRSKLATIRETLCSLLFDYASFFLKKYGRYNMAFKTNTVDCMAGTVRARPFFEKVNAIK